MHAQRHVGLLKNLISIIKLKRNTIKSTYYSDKVTLCLFNLIKLKFGQILDEPVSLGVLFNVYQNLNLRKKTKQF